MSPRRDLRGPASIALLAIASSIVGIVNTFTYDDRYIIELDPAMHSLAHWWTTFATSYWSRAYGGDGYRPLTSLAFKIEYVVGHGRPMVFHAANILLYALASVLVYALARRLLRPFEAWLCAALFAVHPVHVEAVANVVGQSELIVAVALLGATLIYLRDRRAGQLTPLGGAAILGLYALACFAKEHGIVFPAILVAAELTVIQDRSSWRERIARLRPFYLLLVLVAVSTVGVRLAVLADLPLGGFAPYEPFSILHISDLERVLTALGVVPDWIRLLYWPVHLSAEYGPPDIPIAQGFSVAQLPGFMLFAGILMLAVLLRRRRPEISFGVAFAVVTLLPSSNFLLPAGIVLAERTLFLPSVGAMLILGALGGLLADRLRGRLDSPVTRSLGYAMCIVPIAAGMARSVQRTTVWHDNARLFRQSVVDSPLSYRAHYMLGSWHFENNQKRDGEAEYRKALNLFPYDPGLSFNMANRYVEAGFCAPAIPLYRWTFGLDSKFPYGHGTFAGCLLNQGQYADAKSWALDAIRVGASVKDMRRVIFLADSASAVEGRATRSKTPSLAGTPSKLPDSVQKTGVAPARPRG